MNEVETVFVFTGSQRSGARLCALPLVVVERVIRAVALTPSSNLSLLGVIDVQGDIVPVLDLPRASHSSEDSQLELQDQLLLLRCGERRLALVAAATRGVATVAPDAAREVGDAHDLLRIGDELVALYTAAHLLAALPIREAATR